MNLKLDTISNFFVHLTNRKSILLVSLVLSVALYHYIFDNYLGANRNFLKDIFNSVISNSETYKFFSGDKAGGEYSLYYKVGELVKKEAYKRGVKIENLGTNNSALSNAFNVLNNTNSFGIIQSDTYLQAQFLNDPKRIKTISLLYMERLHILLKLPNDETEAYTNLILGKENPQIRQVLENALKSGNLITGTTTSSARQYLHFILEGLGINYLEVYDNIKYGSYSEIFEFLNENSADPKIAFFTLGTHKKVKELLEDPSYNLISIDPMLIKQINQKYNQSLELTYFDNIYDFSEGKPTIGVYAILVASADVTNKEILNFLIALNNGYDDFKEVFENPPILIDEVLEFYKKRYRAETNSIVAEILVFIGSVLLSTFLITNFLMWFTSSYKKAKYYRLMIKDYSSIIDNSLVYTNADAKIENLTRGMYNLSDLAAMIRGDFESGGMTNSDHEYLIDNLDNIYDFYKERMTQRLNDKIESILENKTKAAVLKESLKSEINKLYSDDLLKLDDYQFLIGKVLAISKDIIEHNDDDSECKNGNKKETEN